MAASEARAGTVQPIEVAKCSGQYLVDDAGDLLIDGQHQCTSADMFGELACARKETETNKAQPWKAHWSPALGKPASNTTCLVDEAGDLLIDGQHNCTSADMFGELACARKETGTIKAQPWKAHWSPALGKPASNTIYLVDDAGDLLIDGVHNCTSADSFSELA